MHASKEGAHFELIKHTLCGIPVPRMLWPRIETRESDVEGSYAFLAVARTFTGALLVRYAGRLVLAPDEKSLETFGGSGS